LCRFVRVVELRRVDADRAVRFSEPPLPREPPEFFPVLFCAVIFFLHNTYTHFRMRQMCHFINVIIVYPNDKRSKWSNIRRVTLLVSCKRHHAYEAGLNQVKLNEWCLRVL
jgi:hypothetical protein